MSENSKIEWTDHTFNSWVGCTKVSPACDNCYAESWAKRAGTPELWTGERRRTTVANWKLPKKWNDNHNQYFIEHGRRQRVFCASLADIFDNQVPEEWRTDFWQLVRDTPNLDWLILTKRPQNIENMIPDFWNDISNHIWLGCTVENQRESDNRIRFLLRTSAAIHFLSMEPLFSNVDLSSVGTFLWSGKTFIHRIGWIITGGESGPNARPSHPDWFRSIRDQCQEAGVPFHFKQWGEWAPFNSITPMPDHSVKSVRIDKETLWRVGKKKAGRLLDGREWNEFPIVKNP